MRNIEVYLGNVFVEKLIWDEKYGWYDAEILVDATVFNFVNEGQYTDLYIRDRLLARTSYDSMRASLRKVNSTEECTIWNVLKYNHLRCYNDFLWFKYEGDPTVWEDVSTEKEQEEKDYMDYINHINKFIAIGQKYGEEIMSKRTKKKDD